MLVMSRTVGILTHAWTRVLTTLSIAVTAAILAGLQHAIGRWTAGGGAPWRGGYRQRRSRRRPSACRSNPTVFRAR